MSGSGSAKRTRAPARSAAISHGRTLASWSRRVQTISSPGLSARPAAAEKAIVSAVMLGPNTTPRSSAPSIRATAARAPSTTSSEARACGNAPPSLAVRPERIQSGHRVDRRVDHLGAAGAVQARPAVGEPGEALAVHASPATSSRSCGYVSSSAAAGGISQRSSSTSSLGWNSPSSGSISQ